MGDFHRVPRDIRALLGVVRDFLDRSRHRTNRVGRGRRLLGLRLGGSQQLLGSRFRLLGSAVDENR